MCCRPVSTDPPSTGGRRLDTGHLTDDCARPPTPPGPLTPCPSTSNARPADPEDPLGRQAGSRPSVTTPATPRLRACGMRGFRGPATPGPGPPRSRRGVAAGEVQLLERQRGSHPEPAQGGGPVQQGPDGWGRHASGPATRVVPTRRSPRPERTRTVSRPTPSRRPPAARVPNPCNENPPECNGTNPGPHRPAAAGSSERVWGTLAQVSLHPRQFRVTGHAPRAACPSRSVDEHPRGESSG